MEEFTLPLHLKGSSLLGGVNILAISLALPAILRNETFGGSFFDAPKVFCFCDSKEGKIGNDGFSFAGICGLDLS